MSNLKELRIRIRSVQSTQKITSAMKMVASAKLKRMQEALHSAYPYNKAFEKLTGHVLMHFKEEESSSLLLTGIPNKPVLIVGLSSHRGLCGSYNTNIAREMKELSNIFQMQGQSVYFFPIGKKIYSKPIFSYDNLPPEMLSMLLMSNQEDLSAERLADFFLDCIHRKVIGSIFVVTGHLKNILSQPITSTQLVPCPFDANAVEPQGLKKEFLFEPTLEKLLPQVLTHAFRVKFNLLFLENNACEQAARMTAMDNASTNGRKMLNKLKLQYNQKRQNHITNELMEIIAGANAL